MWLGENCVMASILYRLSKTMRRVVWAGHVARMVKPEGKRPVRGARHMWKNNSIMDLRDQWR
jgi:hypothetical protein